MRWRALGTLLSLAMVGVPVQAGAKLCGDDVHGQDVPCACGDVVVSNVALDVGDPVTSAACASDGLTVRSDTATAVTVDLAGQRLRGQGRGTGLLVLYGGTGGARIVSSGGAATIEGFLDGVVARGDASLGLLDGVVLQGNGRDGLQISASGYEVRRTEARGSGRDGFSVGGKGYRLSGTRAAGNRGDGYAVRGADATLTGAVAEDSGGNGFKMDGMGLRLLDCVAHNGGKDGIHFNGMHVEVHGCTASGNGGAGINGMGMGVELQGNHAANNDGDGLVFIGSWGHDQGGNRGSGNQGHGEHRPGVQCAIGGQPCLP